MRPLVLLTLAAAGCALTPPVPKEVHASHFRSAAVSEVTAKPDGVCNQYQAIRACLGASGTADAPGEAHVFTTFSFQEDPVRANPANWRLEVKRADGAVVYAGPLRVWGTQVGPVCPYGTCFHVGRSLETVPEPWRATRYTFRYAYQGTPAYDLTWTVTLE